jgi:extracellular factor (EF) 3-hydroxypalmitic acid methyl ester biosynthesis protein
MASREITPQKSARHQDLIGENAALLHRRERIRAETLPETIQCRVRHENAWLGPRKVFDVSRNGLAFKTESLVLPPGANLSGLEVLYGGETLWSGPVTCVYQTDERTGVRFTAGYLEVDALKARSRAVARRFESALAQWQTEQRDLSAEWRSGAMAVVELFRLAQAYFDEIEATDLAALRPNSPAEVALIEAVHEQWWPICKAECERMHEASKRLEPETREIAKRFAERHFVPFFMRSPVLARSITKPRGYAGDYVQMIQYNQLDNEGDTAFGRFLHHVGREFPLGRTVVARQGYLASEVARIYESEARPKIVSLASGPAFELQLFLRDVGRIEKPVEIVLVDQDPLALTYAQDELDRVLATVPGRDLVQVSCVNSSVKQILRPPDKHQAQFLEEFLGGSNLTYSAGLLDYLPDKVAAPLVTRLFELLDSPGTLLVGNMKETPASTWIMEHGMSWSLIWREEEALASLAEGIGNAAMETTLDPSGNCVFLKATKA